MPTYLPDIRPDWAKPENRSVFDSPVTKGLRTAADFLGLYDPNAQVANLANPMAIAEAPIRAATHPAVEALTGLLKRELPEANPLAQLATERATNRFLPPAPKLAVPKGFELPEGFNPAPKATSARDAALIQEGYGQFGRSPANAARFSQQQAMLNRTKPSVTDSVRSLEELKDITPAGPIGRLAPPPLSTKRVTGSAQMPKRKASPEVVQHIRSLAGEISDLPLEHQVRTIQRHYGNLKPETIRSIITRDSWNWVE